MRLIHCQGGNRDSAAIATSLGFWYGFRSDDNHYAATLGPVTLVDCHWLPDRLDWPRHLAVCAAVRPAIATVPDTMSSDQLDRTLRQAEQIAVYASPLIVPKCEGIIEALPRQINGRQVILGYSIPTSYGGTPLPLWSFAGWPVHLLGGNPRRQSDMCNYLNVVSADGNLAWRLARRGIVVGKDGVAGKTIHQHDGQRWPHANAHHEALRRSLVNLRLFWAKQRTIDWRPAYDSISPTQQPETTANE